MLPSVALVLAISAGCEGFDSRATDRSAAHDAANSSSSVAQPPSPLAAASPAGPGSRPMSAIEPPEATAPTVGGIAPPPSEDLRREAFRLASGSSLDREPNELGRIPVLEYHLIGENEARWERRHDRFRADLELLYRRGYRPVTLGDLVDRKLDLPAGLSPIVITFDDASPGQFRYIEREDGTLEIDPKSAVGIWLAFNREHPDWENKAVFCMLSGAEAGRSFFGDKGIEGQKTEWRHRKVRFLAEQGFELCNHTLWHANLAKGDDAFVQEQIARGVMAIDSAVPGYRVRSFALPLGMWPKNRELARAGEWTERRKSGDRVVRYSFDVVLEVAGGPARSPHDPQFDPHRLPRVQVVGDEMERVLDQLDRSGTRYVSDGDPRTVARPRVPVAPERGAAAARGPQEPR